MEYKKNIIYAFAYGVVWVYVGQSYQPDSYLGDEQKLWLVMLNPQKFLFLQMICLAIFIYINLKEVDWVEMIVRKGKSYFMADYLGMVLRYSFLSILIILGEYCLSGYAFNLSCMECLLKYMVSIFLFAGIYFLVYLMTFSKQITTVIFIIVNLALDIIWCLCLFEQSVSTDITKVWSYSMITSCASLMIYLADWLLLKRKELIGRC